MQIQMLTSTLSAYVLNAVWEIPLLVFAAEITARLFRGMRAAVIHGIWVGCFCLAIILPGFSFMHRAAPAFGSLTSTSATPWTETPTLPLQSLQEKKAKAEPRQGSKAAPHQESTHIEQQSTLSYPWSKSVSKWLCLSYLVCLVYAWSKLALRIVLTRKLLRSAEPALLNVEVQKVWTSSLKAFQLSGVRLLSSAKVSSPATLSFFRPVVILPADLKGAGPNELESAFCHELAHVRRGDFLLNVFYEASAALLFFHPATHWTLRRIDQTRELACDDMAASAIAGRLNYAHNLLRLAQRMCPTAASPQSTCALGVFEAETMEKRVMNLIETKTKQTRIRACASVFLGATLLGSILAFSATFGLRPVFAEAPTSSDHAPSGWFLTGNKPMNYHTGVDKAMIHDERPSAYLASTISDSNGFGTLMQSIAPTQYAGKRVRLRGWIRSKDVTDWAGLWMRVDNGAKPVAFDNMQRRPIKGTQPWKAYDVVLDVPADATGISFGTLLTGSGQIWLNNVKFDVVGPDVPTTTAGDGNTLSAAPVNLDFQK